ncbi:hypothetical protein GYMLUDRAFT_772362 [Collybiopsis luxurians FD-317 M1]|uniref:Uncharacterized protein n=1 Tax=Collybiopsis luxurians FD-317 M1 TaxID=944289 RepID=A0A0D0BPR9_9AGAR|nr:hypothetical protein GYMLUDRAFT_772362 [Collybiopsis luxurians FD-317 M1]
MSFSMAMISGDGKITWKRESEGAGAKGTQGGTVMMIDTPGPSASASANMNVDVNENESNEYSSRQSATPDREGDLVYPEDMDQNPTLNNIPFPPEMLVPAPALESQNIHHDASRNLRSSTPPSMSSITLLNEDPNGPLGMQNRDDGVHSGSLAPEKIHSGSENIIKLGTDRETTSSFAGTPTSTETQGNKVIMGIGQTDVQVELGNLGPSNQILGSSSGAIIPPVNALDNMIMDSFVPLDTTFSPNIPAMNSTLPSPSVNIVEVNASDEDQARRMRMVDEKMAEPVNSVGLEPVVNARKSLPLESEALNGNSEDAGAAVIAQVFNTRTLRNAQRGTASETQIENVLPGHDTAQRRLSLTVEERDNALVEHDAAQEAHFRLKKSSDSAKRKKDLAVAIKERDAAMVERDTALADKKDLEEELGVAVQSRDAAVAEHHALLADNQKLRKDLDMIIQERDAVMLERDGMLAENRKLEEQMRIYKEYYASGVKLGL